MSKTNKYLIYIAAWTQALVFLGLYVYAFLNPVSPVGLTIGWVVLVDCLLTFPLGLWALFVQWALRSNAGDIMEKCRDADPNFNEETFRNQSFLKFPPWALASTAVNWICCYFIMLLGHPIVATCMIVLSLAGYAVRLLFPVNWKVTSDPYANLR
jgi:hypothetical protein